MPDFSVSERDTADVLGSCERPLSYLFEISWICLGIVCVPRKSWDKPFMNIELVPPCGVENGINRTCPTIFSSHRKHWTDLTTLFVFYVDCLSYATRISGKTSKTSLRCDIPSQRHITQDGEQLLDPLADHFSGRKMDRRPDDAPPERALEVYFWFQQHEKALMFSMGHTPSSL